MKFYSVTQILDKYVKKDFLTEEGRIRGTETHAYFAAYAQGIWTPPLSEEYEGYALSFCRWFNEYAISTIAAEKEYRDEDLGIVCHIDWIGYIKGDKLPSIVDWKTSMTTGLTWEAQVQMYRHLAKKNGIEVGRCGALKVKADGSPATYVPCDSDGQALAAFISALNAERYFAKGD